MRYHEGEEVMVGDVVRWLAGAPDERAVVVFVGEDDEEEVVIRRTDMEGLWVRSVRMCRLVRRGGAK